MENADPQISRVFAQLRTLEQMGPAELNTPLGNTAAREYNICCREVEGAEPSFRTTSLYDTSAKSEALSGYRRIVDVWKRVSPVTVAAVEQKFPPAEAREKSETVNAVIAQLESRYFLIKRDRVAPVGVALVVIAVVTGVSVWQLSKAAASAVLSDSAASTTLSSLQQMHDEAKSMRDEIRAMHAEVPK